MSFFGEPRNHLPTATRLKRAREDGEIAHSHELATAIQMVAGVVTLWFCAASIGSGLQNTTRELWMNSTITADANIAASAQSIVWTTTKLVLPFLISIFVIGTIAHTFQTRFHVRTPRFSLAQVSGQGYLKNLFSFSTVGQIVLATPKVALSLSAGAACVWANRDAFFALGGMPTNVFAASLFRLVASVGICVALTLLALSIFDYAVQWFSLRKRLRMTDQELRDELRGQSGDPQIARVQHERMREISHRD